MELDILNQSKITENEDLNYLKTPEQKNRYLEIDVFKGLSILAVIAIHMSGIIAKKGDLSIYKIDDFFLYSVITRFCVPGFIIASGVVFSLKKNSLGILQFIKNRFSFIVVPYIFWSIFYTFFWAKLNNQPMNFINDILHGTASYHLYFVLIILQFYIIFLIAQKLISYIRIWHLEILFVLQLILNHWAVANQFRLGSYSFVTTFLPWIFVFAFGCYIGRNYAICVSYFEKYRNFLWSGTILSIVYQLTRYLQMYINGVDPRKIPDGTVIVLTVFVFTLIVSYSNTYLKWQNNIIIRFIKRLGILSFGIYLIHPVILPIFVLKINRYFNEIPSYMIFIEYSATALISWGIIELLHKIKFSRYFIGK